MKWLLLIVGIAAAAIAGVWWWQRKATPVDSGPWMSTEKPATEASDSKLAQARVTPGLDRRTTLAYNAGTHGALKQLATQQRVTRGQTIGSVISGMMRAQGPESFDRRAVASRGSVLEPNVKRPVTGPSLASVAGASVHAQEDRTPTLAVPQDAPSADLAQEHRSALLMSRTASGGYYRAKS